MLRPRNLQIISVALVLLAGLLWSQRLGKIELIKIEASIAQNSQEQLELVRSKVEAKSDPLEIFDFGRKLLHAGNPKMAVIALEKSTRLQPQFRDGWYLLGLSYGRLGETAKALVVIDRALTIDAGHQPSIDLKAKLKP